MRRTIRYLIPAVFTLFLAACGGSSSPSRSDSGGNNVNTPPPAPTTGKVTVLITDARGHDWDQAIATITSIEMFGTDDRREVIFEGSSEVDLLSLPDFYEVFAVADNILPGTFDKIRLRLASLELVDLDAEGEEIDRIMAQLVGNGKIDLNTREDFIIGPGDSLYIEIDFDMNKAFKTTTTGNGRVIVRPVVLVNVSAVPPAGRLTRLRGTIDDIDAEDMEFELCQDGLVSGMDDDDDEDDDNAHSQCVDIVTDSATGFFGMDGAPTDFASLVAGDTVTAIGYLRRELDSDDDEEDDDDEDDDDNGNGSDRDLVLDAVTVEVGADFQRVSGAVGGPILGDVFDLDVDPGQELGTDDPTLATQLYPSTRIFHKDGDEIDQSVLAIGVGVIADGLIVPVADMPDSLLASLLIVDPDQEPTDELRSGEIASVDVAANTLQLLVEGVEQCVNAANADIYLLSNIDGLATDRVGIADLEPMQNADVFGDGEDDGGCFLANDILATALPNVIPVAVAGEDQTVTAGEPVSLDGSASTDDDGDTLSYQWTLTSIPEGSTAELSDADMAMASFITDTAGDYVVELIVNDGLEDSAPDTLTVTAE